MYNIHLKQIFTNCAFCIYYIFFKKMASNNISKKLLKNIINEEIYNIILHIVFINKNL